jgi:hypothetical protein
MAGRRFDKYLQRFRGMVNHMFSHRLKSFKLRRKQQKDLVGYSSFRLQKKIRVVRAPIPGAWELAKQSVSTIKKHWTIFAGIVAVHFLLYGVFVYGPTDFDISQTEEAISSVLGQEAGTIESTATLFASVLSVQAQREGSGVFGFLIILIISLATIWVLRALDGGKEFRLRDAFYSGMTPALPVVLILFVMSLQLIPFTVASYIYTIGRSSGVFVSGAEDIMFFTFALLSGLLSFYLLTVSIVALYAVTLPNMYPLHTLRLTKKVLQHRRLTVFRRIVIVPVALLLFFALILLLVIRFIPSASVWFSQIFPILCLPFVHTYLFKLYKSLL